MLTMYWTVELDLRFCPQAIDEMDLLMEVEMMDKKNLKQAMMTIKE